MFVDKHLSNSLHSNQSTRVFLKRITFDNVVDDDDDRDVHKHSILSSIEDINVPLSMSLEIGDDQSLGVIGYCDGIICVAPPNPSKCVLWVWRGRRTLNWTSCEEVEKKLIKRQCSWLHHYYGHSLPQWCSLSPSFTTTRELSYLCGRQSPPLIPYNYTTFKLKIERGVCDYSNTTSAHENIFVVYDIYPPHSG
ncbi:hypothetical protein C1H46_041018 [Malus baccata]|uniref:Uncharacterized protein n=1 Tax=Malus baccata TaxID=106549 RepID=A0A540KHF1_MALBA|nr:hypothetical protein C1H46_041018 [Malus baccata]